VEVGLDTHRGTDGVILRFRPARRLPTGRGREPSPVERTSHERLPRVENDLAEVIPLEARGGDVIRTIADEDLIAGEL
jgi:hypothetical protein